MLTSFRWSLLAMTAGLLAAVPACSSEKPSERPDESANKMVDPDGVYEFGMWNEEWILAVNHPAGERNGDTWTNSLSEELNVVTSSLLVQGQTAESEAVADSEGYVFGTRSTLRFPPEPTPGAPGWWWWGVNETGTTAAYLRAYYIETPRGFAVELRQLTVSGDRGVALLNSLKFR